MFAKNFGFLFSNVTFYHAHDIRQRCERKSMQTQDELGAQVPSTWILPQYLGDKCNIT